MKKTHVADFHKRLHAWYAKFGRKDLPWRNTRDPYAIYVSEIMLQQTQVKTVLERYYHPFLKQFPTLTHLAKAPREKVLKAWEGLGYYNRAANLHEAAKRAANGLPEEVDALLALPGIGRNTAHAVAAFAFHQPVAVMEANVKRVLCRIFALEQPAIDDLWKKADMLLDRRQPFDYNQAMMDIGATICTKRKPACSLCPANHICEGKAAPERYPAAKPKKAVPVRRKIIIVFENERGEIYLERRVGKHLQGLYGFPQFEANGNGFEFQGKRHPLKKAAALGAIRHSYSHYTLEGEVYRIASQNGGEQGEWYTSTQLEKLPISKADALVIALF